MLKRSLPFLLIALVFAGAVAGGGWFYRERRAQNPPMPRNLALGKPGARPPHVHGPTGAPVSIEEFGDYECLPCAGVFALLKSIEAEYKGRISLTFRQYPLKMHQHGMDAAQAAEAAGVQGRFWEMHAAIFEGRAAWTVAGADVRNFFNGYAQAAGVDLAQFARDLTGPTVTGRIAADQERAASVGVDRTPVLFINGRSLPHTAVTAEGLRAEIEKELRGAKK